MTRTLTLRLLANIEYKLLWTEIVLLIALFAGYVYFISASIVNVVLRQEAMVEISAIHSSISTLEADYLTKKQAIDESFAMSEGYAELSATHYITPHGGKVSKRN